MSKVKVHEATRELGVTAGQLLDEIMEMKTQSRDTHYMLKRLQDELLLREEARYEEENRLSGEEGVADSTEVGQGEEQVSSAETASDVPVFAQQEQTAPPEAPETTEPPLSEPRADAAPADEARMSASEIRAKARAARPKRDQADKPDKPDKPETAEAKVETDGQTGTAEALPRVDNADAAQRSVRDGKNAADSKGEVRPMRDRKDQRDVKPGAQQGKSAQRPPQQTAVKANAPGALGTPGAPAAKPSQPQAPRQNQPIVTRDGRILPPRGVEGRVFSKEPVRPAPASPGMPAAGRQQPDRFQDRQADGRQPFRQQEGGFRQQADGRQPFRQQEGGFRQQEGRQPFRQQEGGFRQQEGGFRQQEGGGRPPFQQSDGYRQPFGQRDNRGERPPFGQKDDMGGKGPRPGGMGAAKGVRPGMGGAAKGGRKTGPELTPTVEKERVSNYDPNKKSYERPKDSEKDKKTRKQLNKNTAPQLNTDDEFFRGRKKKKQQAFLRPEPIKIEKAFMTAETITVKDLTERIGKPAGEIIKKLLILGVIATINQELDYDTAQLVAKDFGVELELKLEQTAEEALEAEAHEDNPEDLILRPPVVTIMGHVDHGKTSLLDTIRNTRVSEGEAGGITQHIGAYTVEIKGQSITFLDTPGHEAFTAMRARGAQATDIAVLVIGADDGVMPQTIEAINHAKAANVPIIVAINKIDKPDANIDRVKQELTEYELLAEEWGGSTVMVPVSAKQNMNIDTLLEMILLVAEMQDLRANPNRKARGVIIEAKLDKGRGPVATVLIQSGTLHVGETILAGTAYGRVRAMVNDRGQRVNEAGPSQPVEVIGFNDVPDAGDILYAADNERLSRLVADERMDKIKAQQVKSTNKVSLDDLYNQIAEGQIKDLNVIIKADVQGSVEAVKQALEKIANNEVRVRVIHGGVGAINEADITFATASNAIIVGFNVRPNNMARAASEREKVDVRLYRVIYHAIEDIENAMKGMLTPKFREVSLGHVQVRQVFRVTGVGTIAGSYVTEGKVQRNAQVRLVRDGVVIFEGKIDSLKRHKDDAREVMQGYECGIGLEGYNDVKVDDEIECYVTEKIEV